MNRFRIFTIAFGFILLGMGLLTAQQPLERMSSVPVTQGNRLINSPFAGGVNLPQFSTIDLNADGIQDLFVFDRDGNAVIPYLNMGTATTPDYVFAPQYIKDFPKMKGWVLLRDLDGDEDKDIFTADAVFESVNIYLNTRTTAGPPVFTPLITTLQSDYGLGLQELYVSSYDIPAIVDTDNDGDLDILTFNSSGINVELHRNFALEWYGRTDTVAYQLVDPCWGSFQEDGLNNTITLNIVCKGITNPTDPSATQGHAGSTLCPFDEDGDGDVEMLLGDLTHENLVYVRNGGTDTLAYMDSTEYDFPGYDLPVYMTIFPAGFYEDVTGDGRGDLIVAPNLPQVSENFESVMLYTDVGTQDTVIFEFTNRDFLQRDMIDCGEGSHPAFFDYNGDGLLDIVVGNSDYHTATSVYSSLTLFENVGTAQLPAYQLVTRDYANLTTVFNPALSGISPTFADLDNDGDLDMLLGDSNGLIHILENTAGAGNTAAFSLTQYNAFGIDVGGYATPAVGDLNNDGLPDLVLGEMQGNLNLFINSGTPTASVFPATPTDNKWGQIDVQPICCTGYSAPFLYRDSVGAWNLIVGAESGNLYYYEGVTGDSGATFSVLDTLFGQIVEGEFTTISGADINNDQALDWVVGNSRGGLGLYGKKSNVARAETELTQRIEIFPNPFKDELFVRFPEELFGQKGSLSLLDLNGREVWTYSGTVGQEEVSIDTHELPGAMYIVRMLTEEGALWVEKVVKP